MGKRVCYKLLLAICLLLALQMSAFAAEITVPLANLNEKGESEAALSLFSDSEEIQVKAWGEDSESYYDQLPREDGTAAMIYRALEDAFEADHSGEARMKIAPVTFSDGAGGTVDVDCWVTPVLVEQKWNAKQYGDGLQAVINEWYAEMYANAFLASDAFVEDHPEYFWIRANGGPSGEGFYKTEEDGSIYRDEKGNYYYITTIKFGYVLQVGCETLEKRTALQAQVEAAADALVAKTEGLTDAQRVAYWDNWLANQNAYNHAALGEGINVSCHPWSAVSGLLEGLDPVCEGYAKALQLLCHKAGIPCVQVSGEACGNLDEPVEKQKWESHMWTAIKLDSAWYFCDPTWNDPTITIKDEDGNILEETEYNYSSRVHLLTVQPESHLTEVGTLGTPSIVEKPYFDQEDEVSVVPDDSWADGENVLTGFEIGKGAMMIALYDKDDRMLDMGFCTYETWNEDEYIYLAPTFDAEVLAKAARIVRINVGDVTAWSPLTELKSIREPVPAPVE